jgi:uncharacterized protein
MSGSLQAWYSIEDLGILAARSRSLEGKIPLGQMPRLRDLLLSHAGSVAAGLRPLQRQEGFVTAELSYRVGLELTCQRCLEPLQIDLENSVRVAIVASLAVEPYLPAGFEPVVLEEDRLRPADLLEDELILALPLAPKHAEAQDCVPLQDMMKQGVGFTFD